jgi:hypothetical protein
MPDSYVSCLSPALLLGAINLFVVRARIGTAPEIRRNTHNPEGKT